MLPYLRRQLYFSDVPSDIPGTLDFTPCVKRKPPSNMHLKMKTLPSMIAGGAYISSKKMEKPKDQRQTKAFHFSLAFPDAAPNQDKC